MMTDLSNYRAAVEAAEAAYLAVGNWVDNVRQAAETRMGIDAVDERALDDPDYNQAVRLMGPADELKRLLAELGDVAQRTADELKANAATSGNGPG